MAATMFAYGTLLIPEIIARVIGRVPPSNEARLFGYRRVKVRGEVFPAVFVDPAAEVSGRIYRGIDPQELELLDDYEGDLYRRDAVGVLVDGQLEATECYVLGPGREQHLSSEAWDLECFIAQHAKTYTWNDS
jgi:gamma-glutamylcyclotransferase (GGCT)/AIG2-like uncharacterized protein YtfP